VSGPHGRGQDFGLAWMVQDSAGEGLLQDPLGE
jgi:hypothetical protein